MANVVATDIAEPVEAPDDRRVDIAVGSCAEAGEAADQGQAQGGCKRPLHDGFHDCQFPTKYGHAARQRKSCIAPHISVFSGTPGKSLPGARKLDFTDSGIIAMIYPLKSHRGQFLWLAVGILFVVAASIRLAEVEAQTASTKRAAPPSKSKSAVRASSVQSCRQRPGCLSHPRCQQRPRACLRPADDLRHPASLTKLMTIYLTFSALESGRLSLGDGLPVSLNALNAPPTKMGLPPAVPSMSATPRWRW